MPSPKSPPLRLAIDFDGVIHNPLNKLPGYKLGRPIDGAAASLEYLKQSGAIIVVHSIWADTEVKCKTIAEWCQYFHIPFDFITNKKPDCDFYIDDKGLHFESWPQTLAVLKKRLSY